MSAFIKTNRRIVSDGGVVSMSPGQPARATRIYANQQGPVKSHDLYLPNSAVHQTLGASARTPWLHARIWAHKGNARAKSTGQRPQMDARTQGFLVRTVPVGVWNRLLAVRHQREKNLIHAVT